MTDKLKALVEAGGGIWMGIQDSIQGKPCVVMFRDPQTGSTCGLFLSALRDADDVKAALRRKAEQFAEKV